MRQDSVDACARRCVVNAVTDDRRSVFRRREQVHAQVPDVAASVRLTASDTAGDSVHETLTRAYALR
ncbi:hypothetical protein V2S66_32720 [Streptomyces sp. V4-01]|uniref:Uncharacterized protein n=1 Tax=Actinacidiphila polyblastidii TaxID=3110430 RepID=A0ABU7PLP8_9ACTN|nr:hypothetical protein [Streptomyces sp. V4-01]